MWHKGGKNGKKGQNKRSSEKIRASFLAQKEGFEPSRRLPQPTPLAGEPLRPLGYFCMTDCYKIRRKKWRRERDSNPRYLTVSLVFKTSALNHSAISPVCSNQRNYYTTEGRNLSTLIFKLMENEG